jgi:hypothetical protein
MDSPAFLRVPLPKWTRITYITIIVISCKHKILAQSRKLAQPRETWSGLKLRLRGKPHDFGLYGNFHLALDRRFLGIELPSPPDFEQKKRKEGYSLIGSRA